MKETFMKKLVIFASIIIVLFASLALIQHFQKQADLKKYDSDAKRLYGTTADQLNPETVKLLKDDNYQSIITKDKLDKLIADKATFYVYFFSPTCPHCKRSSENINKSFEQVGKKVVQYNVLEDQSAFTTYEFDATPTIMYYKEGVLEEKIVGEISESEESALTPDLFTTWLESHDM